MIACDGDCGFAGWLWLTSHIVLQARNLSLQAEAASARLSKTWLGAVKTLP